MRSLYLSLEASTPTASVALIDMERGSSVATVDMRARDGERLLPAVVELFHSSGRPMSDVVRIVCSSGPGGFTGLRIAAAVAKGLAESLGVSLYRASPLALLAIGEAMFSSQDKRNGSAPYGKRPVIAILDAMRDEWYVESFYWDARDDEPGTTGPRVARLTRPDIVALAARVGGKIVGVGGGTFEGGREATPQANHIVGLTLGVHYDEVDIAAWEPEYGRLAEAQVKWEAKHGRALGESP